MRQRLLTRTPTRGKLAAASEPHDRIMNAYDSIESIHVAHSSAILFFVSDEDNLAFAEPAIADDDSDEDEPKTH